MIKFIKYENGYWATKNNVVIETIHTHYNFFDNKYFYTIGDKIFKKLNDAKKHIRENY